MKLILFGFKRCGKTHYGKLLAKELGWTFIDTDDRIEGLYEKLFYETLSCRQIALKEGEAAFRALEKEAVHSIEEEGDAIISLGGGAILDPDNYQWLIKLGTLVYLQIDKETLQKRILSSELPSYLNPDNPQDSFEKMYAERKPLYEKIEAVTINTSGKNESQILEELKKISHG